MAAGYVAEASGMNLFAVSNSTLKTPPPYTGILRGVTRDTVIELGREAGYAVEELPMNRYDLYTADEVFLTAPPPRSWGFKARRSQRSERAFPDQSREILRLASGLRNQGRLTSAVAAGKR